MAETAIQKAQRKFEQAKAALDAIKAREAAADRKKDTRRKIVLGGALLELAKTDKDASALVSRLVAGLARDHDKKLFEKGGKGETENQSARIETARDGAAPKQVSKPMPTPPRPGNFIIEPDPEVI